MYFGALTWNSFWRPPERRMKVLAIALLCVFIFQGAAALREMSSTGDETHYLGMGRYLLRTHRWDLTDALLHPPLSYYLQSALLYFEPIDFRAFDIPDINARGRALMAASSDDRLLHLARWPVLLLAVLLGVLVVVWGWQSCGPAAGLAALFLYAFSPAILSNATLITPDLCLTFFSTLTFYFLWRYLRRQTLSMILLVGIALGLALLSKYAAILVVLAVVFIAAMHKICNRLSGRSVKIPLRHLAMFFLVTILVVNAGYLFTGAFRFLDDMSFKSRLFQRVAGTGVLHWLPSPLPQAYVAGMDLQYTVVENGFRCFLLGKVHSRGVFLYYVVAFFSKTPVALLLLIVLALIFHRKFGNETLLMIVLMIPVAIFFSYFSLTRVSRGIRYILPVYPLLFIWVSHAGMSLAMRVHRWKPVMAVLALWYAVACLSVAPHYMAYFNELCGGPNNGVNILDESDFDWGQELKSLGNYLREHEIPRVQLSYFGTADPQHYGVSYDSLPCDAAQALKSNEPIAVSATALHWDCNWWLRGLKPADRIGYTILLFNLPEDRSPQNPPPLH